MSDKTLNPTLSVDDVRSFLKVIGENPDREGLKGTPDRVRRAINELFLSYQIDEESFLSNLFNSVFDSKNDSMIVKVGLPVRSFCEHHILPFYGTCNIGYIPDGKVIGISKLARLVNFYSRRLQIQENLTTQIADTLYDKLKCKGVMVTVTCTHLCMVFRGVNIDRGLMTTSRIKGAFEKESVRMEFFELCKRDNHV